MKSTTTPSTCPAAQCQHGANSKPHSSAACSAILTHVAALTLAYLPTSASAVGTATRRGTIKLLPSFSRKARIDEEITVYSEYCGMAVMCGKCFEAKRRHFAILWANGNGAKFRVFCPVCGHTTDKKRIGNMVTVVVSKTPWNWGSPRDNPIGHEFKRNEGQKR